MIRTDKLAGLMAEKSYSKTAMAKALGITPNTFRRKLAKGVFDSNEISVMMELLDIEDPTPVFFAKLGNNPYQLK